MSIIDAETSELRTLILLLHIGALHDHNFGDGCHLSKVIVGGVVATEFDCPRILLLLVVVITSLANNFKSSKFLLFLKTHTTTMTNRKTSFFVKYLCNCEEAK